MDKRVKNATQPRRNGPGRPFLPGNNANPRGRPRYALAYAVRRITSPDEIAQFLYDVWHDKKRKFQDRRWAAEQLMDRGYGRPVQQIELDAAIGSVTVSAGFDLGLLSTDDKRSLMEILRRARTLADRGGDEMTPELGPVGDDEKSTGGG